MKIALKDNNFPKAPGLYLGSNGASGHLPALSEVVCLTPWNPDEPRCKLLLKVNSHSHHPLDKIDPATKWSDKIEFVEVEDTEGEILRRNLLTSDTALANRRGLLHTRMNLETLAEAAKRRGMGKLAHATERAAQVINEYTGTKEVPEDWPEFRTP